MARLAVLRMYGRDTKSESLEFMGREEGTVSLMQEHGADYVAADRMKGSGVAAARNQFYVHLVTCAHQRLSQSKPWIKGWFHSVRLNT